jgi:hypothetical protein
VVKFYGKKIGKYARVIFSFAFFIVIIDWISRTWFLNYIGTKTKISIFLTISRKFSQFDYKIEHILKQSSIILI